MPWAAELFLQNAEAIGLDLHARDERGRTPLQLASKWKRTEIEKMIAAKLGTLQNT